MQFHCIGHFTVFTKKKERSFRVRRQIRIPCLPTVGMKLLMDTAESPSAKCLMEISDWWWVPEQAGPGHGVLCLRQVKEDAEP